LACQELLLLLVADTGTYSGMDYKLQNETGNETAYHDRFYCEYLHSSGLVFFRLLLLLLSDKPFPFLFR
jgi:hypothetical protein